MQKRKLIQNERMIIMSNSTLAILIGLGPFIGWGLFPTIASKFGGKPTNQILGATMGTFIFAVVFTVVGHVSVPGGMAFLLSMISGFGWGFGQTFLFQSFTHVGSSIAMPISTALQLIVTALWGVVALGNWPGWTHKLIGLACLLVIILGATMTSWKEHKSSQSSKQLRAAIVCVVIAVVGQWLYSAAPQATNVSGASAFLPQAIGMLLTAVVYALLQLKKHNYFKDHVSYTQIISGFFFAFGSLTYLVSARPQFNGLATAFVLSQASVILATLTGIYLLHQRKTPKEMVVTVIGLILIVVATSVTAFL